MRILAIIPARRGSTDLPTKSLLTLAGKPLIVWTIEHGLGTREITDTVVSTDSPEIAEVAGAAGAQVPFLRPTGLASDQTRTEQVMLHALKLLEQARPAYDVIALLQPTLPLRSPDMTSRAIAQMREEQADSLLSVTESRVFFWQREPVRASYDFRNRPRRTDLAPANRYLRETGSLYLMRRHVLAREQNRLGGRVSLFETSGVEGIELAAPADVRLLESIMPEVQTA
jgi:N-acylneuraminate cytidylyltransferase